jgi:hypothetical protein
MQDRMVIEQSSERGVQRAEPPHAVEAERARERVAEARPHTGPALGIGIERAEK